MDSEYRALDRIERALDQAPHCRCGEPVVPVARDGGIWLECSTTHAPARSRIGRLVAHWNAQAHTRELVVDWIGEAA